MSHKVKIECPVMDGKVTGCRVIIDDQKYPAKRGELYDFSNINLAIIKAFKEFMRTQIQTKKLPFKGYKF